MDHTRLRVALAQWDLVWEYPEPNFTCCDELLDGVGAFDLAVLPEMFSTGFTMRPGQVATNIGARSLDYLRRAARARGAGFCASTIVHLGDGRYANRCYLTAGHLATEAYYDKRHLFAPAGEHAAFATGLPQPTVVPFAGWRLLLQVCYDLRFPVYSHNAGTRYDLAVYVANWPHTRRTHWLALLRARAIENQCYVVGVNRVGRDERGLEYAGDSCVFGPGGEALLELGAEAAARVVTLDLDELRGFRQNLPFLQDTDDYVLRGGN